jgi:hypothetical protein
MFRSWLLLFGVLLFDRHALALEAVTDGEGFVEESTSWMQRRWRHERLLTETDAGGCIVAPDDAPVRACAERPTVEKQHERAVPGNGVRRRPSVNLGGEPGQTVFGHCSSDRTRALPPAGFRRVNFTPAEQQF